MSAVEIVTERRGRRVVAVAGDASAEVEWRDDLDEAGNHLLAARALRRRLGLTAGLHGSTIVDGLMRWRCGAEAAA